MMEKEHSKLELALMAAYPPTLTYSKKLELALMAALSRWRQYQPELPHAHHDEAVLYRDLCALAGIDPTFVRPSGAEIRNALNQE